MHNFFGLQEDAGEASGVGAAAQETIVGPISTMISTMMRSTSSSGEVIHHLEDSRTEDGKRDQLSLVHRARKKNEVVGN
jgi:hypothetical protein